MFAIKEKIYEAEQIEIIKDGAVAFKVSKGDSLYKKILKEWSAMTEKAHQMPAFGVSIDDLTREEKKSGLWIEFVFGEEKSDCDMPFTKLLAAVKPKDCGLNLIRWDGKGYNGRCFYLDLNGETSENFYKELELLCKGN